MSYENVNSTLGADFRLASRPPAAPRVTARLNALLPSFLARYGLVLAFLALWQISSTQGWVNPAVFPPLHIIVAALWDSLASGALIDDIAISLQRSGIAFAAAVAIGIPLGLVMGQAKIVEQALDPLLQFFRQTSALALYPVFILLLGLGETSKVFVIFWATLFPILLATIGGVKEVDGKLVEMARTYGAGRLTIFRRVILPASVPAIFVGLRLSATTALLLLIAAEMIGANKGIGFQVMNAQYNFQIPLMFAAILLLALLGLIANAVLVLLQKKLCRWSQPNA
ncbi:ABC transporter permease [Shinella yambaruensis]|uniref:ABC transporter permease n=1 Tax=Shinella yambaruensis TaxID=415996 RepID=A0ABQ5ZHF2_9HYPH|nr:ABC transporter permease [Shinella yambaruensis]MCJ8025120.1 ABC transporter permease [Shinella yambaruensis]MCU7980675.1 ABC transporter permease [Shinella yambaruensis]GLR52088.1 ABC transporter permease [Shinella yambaruensis]